MTDVKEDTKKIVRILLRVSSDQQLEANGDLSIQRNVLGLGLRSFIPPEIEKDLTEQHLQIIRRFKKGS